MHLLQIKHSGSLPPPYTVELRGCQKQLIKIKANQQVPTKIDLHILQIFVELETMLFLLEPSTLNKCCQPAVSIVEQHGYACNTWAQNSLVSSALFMRL